MFSAELKRRFMLFCRYAQTVKRKPFLLRRDSIQTDLKLHTDHHHILVQPESPLSSAADASLGLLWRYQQDQISREALLHARSPKTSHLRQEEDCRSAE